MKKKERKLHFEGNRHQLYTPKDFLILKEESLTFGARVYINTGVISKALGSASVAFSPATGTGLIHLRGNRH